MGTAGDDTWAGAFRDPAGNVFGVYRRPVT